MRCHHSFSFIILVITAEGQEPSPKCCASTTSSGRCQLVEEAVPVNTKKAMETWVSAVDDYAIEKGHQRIDYGTVKADFLGELLEGFYADARKKRDGRSTRGTACYLQEEPSTTTFSCINQLSTCSVIQVSRNPTRYWMESSKQRPVMARKRQSTTRNR
eukprot:scpid80415/ scgid27769/ 